MVRKLHWGLQKHYGLGSLIKIIWLSEVFYSSADEKFLIKIINFPFFHSRIRMLFWDFCFLFNLTERTFVSWHICIAANLLIDAKSLSLFFSPPGCLYFPRQYDRHALTEAGAKRRHVGCSRPKQVTVAAWITTFKLCVFSKKKNSVYINTYIFIWWK